MRRTTDDVNRKKYRKNVIYMYRGILKEIRWRAKYGYCWVDFRSFDIRPRPQGLGRARGRSVYCKIRKTRMRIFINRLPADAQIGDVKKRVVC